MQDLDRLPRTFHRFAELEWPGMSALYESLCHSLAGDRDLSLISLEARSGHHHCAVELTQYGNGVKTNRRLADNDSHGNWIQWLESGSAAAGSKD